MKLRPWIFNLILFLALTCGVASAQLDISSPVSVPIAWTWVYEANALPDVTGTIESPAGTAQSTFVQTLGNPVSESVSGGVYTMSTVNNNSAVSFTAPSLSPLLHLNSDRGYTVEWRAKILDIDTAESGNSVALQVDEGRPGMNRFWNLTFLKNSSGQYRASLEGETTATPVTSNISLNTFYTFRVTARNDTATLYVNNTTIGTVANLRNLQTDIVAFGDQTSTTDGNFAMDYLRVYDGAAVLPQDIVYPHHIYTDPGNSSRKFRLAYVTPLAQETQTGYQGEKIWYQVSNDGGSTYDTLRPLVQQGSAYNPTHPIAPVYVGRNDFIASSFAPPTRVSNGEILVPFDYTPLNAEGTDVYNPYGTTTFRHTGVLIGKWNQAGTDLTWDLGGTLSLDSHISTRGLFESAIVELNTPGRIMMVARGSNANNTSVESHTWKAVSNDYGRTWSDVTELTYSDDTPFFTPSSMSDIRRNSGNNKIYWFGNLLASNANGNDPRYPLVIAEVDQNTLGLIPGTVQTIVAYTPGSPEFDTTQVQFSNFTVTEDPSTHAFLVKLYRYDPGKDPNASGPYQTFTVVVNPEPDSLSFLMGGCALLRGGFRARAKR